MGEPLSRVEAILQNILGADNILVPPGSQVEEILQAIYYNTEYEKNPKSRVAEILLAIKNKGVYDGPVLSRMEDILVHKLNNIPYTKHKKEDLSRVEQLLLDWLEQGGGEEIIEYTGTFPMTILANGEPLLDYLISGNTVQNGTPTPDSPIMPEGTGERTGNLSDPLTEWEDGYLNSNGNIADANPTRLEKASGFIEITNKETLAFSYPNGFPSPSQGDGWRAMCFYTADKTHITRTDPAENYGETPLVVNIPANAKYVRLTFRTFGQTDNPMLNLGSTALPYEPYGIKIPISSANTTTPVYLGEVETTRKIEKLVFDGTETGWGMASGFFYNQSLTPDYLRAQGQNTLICSHYKSIAQVGSGSSVGNNQCSLYYPQSVQRLYIKDNNFSTLDEFKQWLSDQYAAGTPVTIWYVLATETTGIVNEPLMRIGDYADTLSMEQAGVDVPTNKKPTETVIDVPTSVKPSEGYIKYTEPTDGPTPKTQVLGTKNHEIYMTSNDEVYILRR